MLGLSVPQCLLCCELYTSLFNMVHGRCLQHGRLWSPVLVCVKCGLCSVDTLMYTMFCGGRS